MSYEFDDAGEELRGNIPRLPSFWSEPRIFGLMPMDMSFISWNSVVINKDKTKPQIGIDTTDFLPHPDNIRFKNTDQSIGIVRLMLEQPVAVDGYVVDLRYATRFPRRELEFRALDSTTEDEDDPRTVPSLGALFVNPINGKLLLSCKKEYEKGIQPFAVDLAKFVDEERRRRGGLVLGDDLSQATGLESQVVASDTPRQTPHE